VTNQHHEATIQIRKSTCLLCQLLFVVKLFNLNKLLNHLSFFLLSQITALSPFREAFLIPAFIHSVTVAVPEMQRRSKRIYLSILAIILSILFLLIISEDFYKESLQNIPIISSPFGKCSETSTSAVKPNAVHGPPTVKFRGRVPSY